MQHADKKDERILHNWPSCCWHCLPSSCCLKFAMKLMKSYIPRRLHAIGILSMKTATNCTNFCWIFWATDELIKNQFIVHRDSRMILCAAVALLPVARVSKFGFSPSNCWMNTVYIWYNNIVDADDCTKFHSWNIIVMKCNIAVSRLHTAAFNASLRVSRVVGH